DGCVTYTAGDKAGKEAPICVVACDASTGICDTTIIDITVTPPCDIFNKDSLTVECNGFGKGEYCMPLSLEALANYDLYIDGSLTALTVANASGCGSEVVSAGYGFQTVGYIDNVPHLLEEWSISSDSIVRPNIVFSTLTDLVGYMNSVDASGAWYVDGMNVRPANPSASYRTGTGLVYFALQPEVRTTYISYNYYVGYSSANLLIDQGCHELKVVNKVTGCSDSIVLCVETCIGDIIYDTIPVKGRDSICTFVTPNNGAITITGCDGSVSGEGNFVDWSINAGCLVYEAGNQKGTDTICIKVCARESEGKEFCYETNVIVTVVGIPPIAVDNDTTTKVNTSVAIPVLGNDIQTDDDLLVLCTIITDPLHGTIQVDYATGIITYTPDNDYRGVDSLQYEICDPDGNDTAWVYIRIVKENECELLNAFSPNGDGVNDTYYIPCVDVSNGDLEFRVFNRWGIEVYHNLKYDNNNGWDGKYKGSPLPDGTYYYVIKYINKDNEQINKAGFIVIQR
ncbi:MAG: gliding motility-associated C-terminal domain-containing protein, partial [Chitinophagales bacterium]|nr:gliding motility-associated C-terminal domain-containing protein [Chitinophagales bacterium]